MRTYNIAYRVLLEDGQQLTVTPVVAKKLIKVIVEIEKVALTDDDFNALIVEEVNNNLR